MQLPLDLHFRPAMDAEDFLVAGANADAVALVDSWPDWPGPWMVIHGPAGCGKTHLIHVWRRVSGATIISGADIRAGRIGPDCVPDRPVSAADAWPAPGPAMAVEDAVEVAGERNAETRLLHILNRVRDSGGTLVLTGREPASRWPILLPDLASRVRAAASVAIRDPDDDLLAAVLVKLFSDRQVVPTADLVSYVLKRIDRDFATVRRFVAALDRESLATKRAPTIPMARRVLQEARFGGRPPVTSSPSG